MESTGCCCHDACWIETITFLLARLERDLHAANRELFEEAFRTFAVEVPPLPGTLASLWLRDRLINVCDRAAASLHASPHECGRARCDFPPPRHFHPAWSRWDSAPQTQLLRWLGRFLQAFDASHPVGLPVRTAKLLRRRGRVHVTMEEVAYRMRCSRSVLERRFEGRYGLTPKAFHTRVRLRAAVIVLNSSDVKVEHAARSSGYSVAGFHVAIDKYTGSSPSKIRGLTPEQVAILLSNRLEVDVARLVGIGSKRNEVASRKPIQSVVSAFALE